LATFFTVGVCLLAYYYFPDYFIGSKPPDIPLGWLIGGLLVGVVLLHFTVRLERHDARLLKALRQAPASAISAAGLGINKIEGTLRAKTRRLTSPLKNRRCVYYKLTLTKSSRSSGDVSHQVQLGNHSEVVATVVHDGSSQLAVDMSNFNFATKTSIVHVGKNNKKLQSIAQSVLGVDIQPTKTWYPQYMLSETFVPDNQQGFAIGEISDTEDGRVLTGIAGQSGVFVFQSESNADAVLARRCRLFRTSAVCLFLGVVQFALVSYYAPLVVTLCGTVILLLFLVMALHRAEWPYGPLDM
jgi:hypothetical protein